MSENELIPKKVKILYIDDDNELVDIYCRFFEKSEYIFKTAYDAESGYELAKTYLPDLIISDVAMPGWSGFDLCKKIRDNQILKDVIFILVSGLEVEPEDIILGLKTGADDYLVKPFMRDVLFAKIKSFLRIKTLKDSLEFADNVIETITKQGNHLAQELCETKENLTKEKDILNNSFKQISLMLDKEKRNNIEISKLKTQTDDTYKNLILLLSELIESKPQFHRGHSTNVGKIAETIATMLDLSPDETADIKTAGLLHEIGRISIPEALAKKSYDDYTRSEKDMLMQHPVKGEDLLKAFPEFENVKKIIRHIHERVDGTGFPNGLKKKKIPFGSKIIAVINAFDNLLFRTGEKSIEETFEIIERDVGTKYDSKVVNCLRRYISRHPYKSDNNFIEIRLYEAKPGMKLAAGVYTLKGAKLLPENTILTEENIEKIAQYNKIEPLEETVFIKG